MAQVRVCVCRDGMEAHFLRGVLEAAGIGVTIVGEALGQLAGSIPVADARPELWVDEGDADRAARALAAARANRLSGAANEWVCPNCGEAIEGQFTDCWKCQTARSVSERASLEPVQADVEPVIDADIPCRSCRYNLRGVPVTHRCPECGKAILPTLTAAWRVAEGPQRRAIREVMRHVAAQLGYPLEAVLFLLSAYAAMAERIGREPSEADVRAIDGPVFCAAIGWEAVQQFGTPERAKEVLREWGVGGSWDVGRVLAVAWDVPPEAVVGAFARATPLDEWF